MTSEELNEPASISFATIYGQLVLEDEIILTIPIDAVESAKQGLKNFKAKSKRRMGDMDIQTDDFTIEFATRPSTVEGAVDLVITAKRRGTIPVFKVTVPEKEL